MYLVSLVTGSLFAVEQKIGKWSEISAGHIPAVLIFSGTLVQM